MDESVFCLLSRLMAFDFGVYLWIELSDCPCGGASVHLYLGRAHKYFDPRRCKSEGARLTDIFHFVERLSEEESSMREQADRQDDLPKAWVLYAAPLELEWF